MIQTNYYNNCNIYQNNPNDFIFPEDFGAVGDGVTDDAAALQSCIVASADQKKTIYFKSGKVYRCYATLMAYGAVQMTSDSTNPAKILFGANCTLILLPSTRFDTTSRSFVIDNLLIDIKQEP